MFLSLAPRCYLNFGTGVSWLTLAPAADILLNLRSYFTLTSRFAFHYGLLFIRWCVRSCPEVMWTCETDACILNIRSSHRTSHRVLLKSRVTAKNGAIYSAPALSHGPVAIQLYSARVCIQHTSIHYTALYADPLASMHACAVPVFKNVGTDICWSSMCARMYVSW